MAFVWIGPARYGKELVLLVEPHADMLRQNGANSLSQPQDAVLSHGGTQLFSPVLPVKPLKFISFPVHGKAPSNKRWDHFIRFDSRCTNGPIATLPELSEIGLKRKSALTDR